MAPEKVNCPDWIRIVEVDVPAGTTYWRLTRFEYQDDQSSGGNHHIYSREPHDPATKMLVSNGQQAWTVALDKPTNEAAGNFAMWAHNHYSASIDGAPSDRVEGMYMPANHHVNYLLSWEKAVKEGGKKPEEVKAPVTPLQPVSSATLLEAALLKRGEEAQVIRFNPSAAIQKVIFQEGFVPNSTEFEVTQDGTTFVAQRAERLSDGAVRIFYVKKGDWGNVMWVVRKK